jgi:hypothetical protein
VKKIWILLLLTGLAACEKKTTNAMSELTEVRLVREPMSGACFVVVATTFGGGSLAVAPAPCPPPGSVEVLPAAADGGLR